MPHIKRYQLRDGTWIWGMFESRFSSHLQKGDESLRGLIARMKRMFNRGVI